MNPVSFQDDIAAERDRWERDCRLAQKRCDELQSTAEHELREASLQIVELRIENNNLRSTMREIAGVLGEVLQGLDKLR
jgi:hypothetical protein